MTRGLLAATAKIGIAAALYNQIAAMVYDARLMFLGVVLLIAADFWYSYQESAKRYAAAEEAGDKAGMEAYKWRKSRSWRRTLTKFTDYFMVVVVGMILGAAMLPQIGVDYFWGVWVAGIAVCICEVASIGGHFLYLHADGYEGNGLQRFAKVVLVALVKKKSEDLGEALEEGLKNNTERDSVC